MPQDKHYKVKFNFKPYPLQQEILDCMNGKVLNRQGNPYRFFVATLGRQSGKSWLARYVVLDYAVNRSKVCMWVAPAISTARKHWNELVRLIEKSGIPVKKISQTAKEIHFHGGGTISIRSAIEPDNLRGESLDLLVMDEAAFYRNGEYVWYNVCLPMITATGGIVLFTTTPNGRNWFYEVYRRGIDEADLYHKSWRVPSYASPYQDKTLLDEIKRFMPSRRWREEFEAEFLADAGGVFVGVEEAAKVPLQKLPTPKHRYAAGVDFGLSNDATTFTVLDMETREQVYGERFTSVGTASTIRRVIELLNVWQPEVTHIEKNGLGETLFNLLVSVLSGRALEELDTVVAAELPDISRDEAVDYSEDRPRTKNKIIEVGGHRLVPVHMNNQIKRALVERLSADVEFKRLFLLDDQTEYGRVQISEMSTYERKRTAGGLDITYGAKDEAHDDTVTGLYLANKGMPKPKRWRLPGEPQPTQHKGSPFRNRGGLRRKMRPNAKRS